MTAEKRGTRGTCGGQKSLCEIARFMHDSDCRAKSKNGKEIVAADGHSRRRILCMTGETR